MEILSSSGVYSDYLCARIIYDEVDNQKHIFQVLI
jgi:hypothetical protein